MPAELPPCIVKAVKARDTSVLEEIISYIKTYATPEEANALLWSIGYFSLDNYNARRATLEALIRSAPHFPCTPFEKPPLLSKYCTEEDEAKCPLRNGWEKLNRLVEAVSLEFYEGRPLMKLTIRLRDGSEFVADKVHYVSTADEELWHSLARQFLDWYSSTHHGINLPDGIPLPVEDVADFILRKALGGGEAE